MATEATFPIKLESNAKEVSKEAADAMEKLRSAIEGSTNKIRALEQQQRLLKGSTADVIKAKTELKAKINAEQAEVTKATLALSKMGKTYGELAQQAKKASAAEAEQKNKTEGIERALKGLGLGDKVEKLSNLGKAFGKSGAAATVAVIGVVALTAAFIAMTAAIASAAFSIGSFIIENANAQRNMALTQEGLLGTAKDARNFADQIDDVARRVPMAKDELAKLGDELAGKGLKGDALVDAMDAVAQTASAKGAAAGDELKKELIASLGGGAKEAREKAEKEFGALNAKKLLDLNVQGQRFKETMQGLTRDVNLEPLLKGVQEILSVFDESTVSGQALHDLVTMIGDGLSTAVGESAPFVKTFLKQLLIYALEGAILFLQLKRQISDAFGPDTAGGVDLLNAALVVAKVSIAAIAANLLVLYAGWRVVEAAVGAVKKLLTEGWADIAKNIITGLVNGLTGGAGSVVGAVTGLAGKVKDSFTSALGIHSPSKVFEEYGVSIPEGAEVGVKKGAPAAQSAVNSMVGAPSGSAGGGGASRPEVHVHIHADGSGGGDVAKQLTQPSVLAAITKAFEDALAGNGLTPEGA